MNSGTIERVQKAQSLIDAGGKKVAALKEAGVTWGTFKKYSKLGAKGTKKKKIQKHAFVDVQNRVVSRVAVIVCEPSQIRSILGDL